ncbi:hypothetical protein V1264_024452 [Littorina saxatilis]|uniref:Uncharacterized protein n=1 Tax=Littorina saxatilis TaxID=31220 RepID=A0AAN9ALU9_9CAEN
MKAADVFNYPKQQNVIRSGTGSDDSCSTQSEEYLPPLPLYVQGPKTRCVSVAGRLQLRDTIHLGLQEKRPQWTLPK